MIKSQFIFSLVVGAALMAAGAALATGGVTDWGLFWVGALISSLTLGTHARESKALPPVTAQALMGATPQADR